MGKTVSALFTALLWLTGQPIGETRALDRLFDATVAQSSETSRYAPPETDQLADLLDHLMRLAIREDIRLGTIDGDSVWGQSQTRLWPYQIWLHTSLSVDGSAQVLAHELSHVLGPSAFRTGWREAEVTAEATAYLVVRRAGLDDRDRFARYLAGYKDAAPAIRLFRLEIVQTADRLCANFC